MRFSWLIVVVLVGGIAHAAPDADAPPKEPTAADVAGAPPPGGESGRADGEVGDSTWRAICRGALFVPKLAIQAVLTPVRGALWLDERYHLQAMYRRVFFNDAYTIGLVPTAKADSLFGVSLGARFVDRDVFGEREHVSAQVVAGGEYRAAVAIAMDTGDRLGDHLVVRADGEWERRPHDPFYGLGNGDLATALPAMPIDPRTDATAIESSSRVELERVALGVDVRPFDGVHLLATSALTQLAFGPGDHGAPLEETFMTSGLVGYSGVTHLYDELELRVDRRRRATVWEPRAIYAEGTLIAAFAGRVHRLDAGADFWRTGIELQQLIRLADGPRVLALRFRGEAVSGSRDEVPFTELPRLGGGLLRGYASDRFRDRISALGSAEYLWDLSRWVDAAVFVDAGRVYESLAAASVADLRVGYGVALQLHGDRSFLVELSLASSIDGGVFASVAFNRAYDAHPRWR